MSGWLLLHGFTGAPEVFDTIVEGLEPPVLAPALLGHGPSPPLGSQTFQQEIERLGALVRERLRGPAHLLGYSMGARVALAVLNEHPELFQSALLIGVNPGVQSEAERVERKQQDAAWRLMIENQGVDQFLDRWQSLPLFETQQQLPHVVLEAQRRLRQTHTKRGLCQALDVLGLGSMPNYWPKLGKLNRTVRLIVGERDHKFRHIGEVMIRELPHATLHVIPRVGHNVLLEAPWTIQELAREQHRGSK